MNPKRGLQQRAPFLLALCFMLALPDYEGTWKKKIAHWKDMGDTSFYWWWPFF